jgi:NADH-ubiquinone oxidoreductase chain 1
MTEHAAVIFVFFFLAEYGSIVLICILNTVLFLGGYLLDLSFINNITYIITDCGLYLLDLVYNICHGDFSLPTYIPYDTDTNLYSPNDKSLIEGILSGFAIGIKSCVMIFIFI